MLTKDQAMTHRGTLYHVSLKDSRGAPLQCRTNGACKTWVTRPSEFKLPVKYGMYQYFYITQDSANEWSL